MTGAVEKAPRETDSDRLLPSLVRLSFLMAYGSPAPMSMRKRSARCDFRSDDRRRRESAARDGQRQAAAVAREVVVLDGVRQPCSDEHAEAQCEVRFQIG